MGLTQQDVGSALGAALGGGYVNYFSIAGRSYKVIPQVLQVDRLNPDQVLDYYMRRRRRLADPGEHRGAHQDESVPESINHFQQLNSATIAGAAGRVAGRCAEVPARHAAAGRARPATPWTTRASRASSCRSPAASW